MSDDKPTSSRKKTVPERLQELQQGLVQLAETAVKTWQVVQTLDQRLTRMEGQTADPDTVPPCPHCGVIPEIEHDGRVCHECGGARFWGSLYDWSASVQLALQGEGTGGMHPVEKK
jgi:hypothetical protein